MSYAKAVFNHDPLQVLPIEMCVQIIAYLDPASIANASRVCSHWSSFTSLDVVWKHVYHREHWQSPLHDVDSVTVSLRCSEPDQPWRTTYVQRQRLENNWDAGRYTTYSLKAGFRVTATRLRETLLFTGDTTGTIWRRDLTNRRSTSSLFAEDDRSEIRCLELDPTDPENIIISGSRSGSLAIWNIPQRRRLQHYKHAHLKNIESIRLNNLLCVTASTDKTIKVWRRAVTTTGDNNNAWSLPLILTWTLAGHTAAITALHLLPGLSTPSFLGTLVSTSPGDRSIRTWNLTNGHCVSSYACPNSVARSHLDGQRVCVRSSEIQLYDEQARRQVGTIRGKKECVTLAAVALWRSDRMARVVTGGSDGYYIWSVGATSIWATQPRLSEDDVCRFALSRKTGAVQCLQVDARRVVGVFDTRIMVWDFS